MNPVKRKTYYNSLLPIIRESAYRCGYAIATHGSMRRDMDLVAIPWTKKALAQSTLVKRICKVTDGLVTSDIGQKPHGRKAYIIILKQGGGAYTFEKNGVKLKAPVFIDLSIMPRT